MDFADGKDLETLINERKTEKTLFQEKTIWSIFIQAVHGVNAIHKLKATHRDLKSANIFMTKEGVVKIADFNVSKICKQEELIYTQTGTPYYAAPEVWKDIPYD